MSYPVTLPRCISEDEAEGMLSRAYSSLKDKYIEVKTSQAFFKHQNKELRKELEDYKLRYDNLIKYINEKEE